MRVDKHCITIKRGNITLVAFIITFQHTLYNTIEYFLLFLFYLIVTVSFRDELVQRLQEAHHNNQGSDLKLLDLAMKSRTDGINNKING